MYHFTIGAFSIVQLKFHIFALNVAYSDFVNILFTMICTEKGYTRKARFFTELNSSHLYLHTKLDDSSFVSPLPSLLCSDWSFKIERLSESRQLLLCYGCTVICIQIIHINSYIYNGIYTVFILYIVYNIKYQFKNKE